ncbi:IMPACT family protein [Rhodanobacter sp. BL-MT-08]
MSGPLETLTQRCRHQDEIKKSRFLALAAPVETSALALAFVQEVAYPAATHNCWAYRIGQDYRFNDDGEPGGTAGRPILQAIEGQGMDGVVVVVTRWYGGIKLGAGGLMRAYGGTAAECLRRAERLPIVSMVRLGLHCDFAELSLLKARLKDWQADIRSETFDADGVQLQLQLPENRVAEAQARIIDISRGRNMAMRLD